MKVKKKIFFLLYSMNVGGVEKSLLNLLSVLPREKYDIHVGLVHQEGGLLPYLPSDVTVHHIADIKDHWDELKNPPLHTIKTYLQTGRFFKTFLALIVYLVCKLSGSYYWWVASILKCAKGIDVFFDVAVAYSGPSSDIDFYVCKKIEAKKKVGWIHFDIDKVGHDTRLIQKLYCNYDTISIVSDSCKQKFENQLPIFKKRLMTINNIVSPKLILSQAENGVSFGTESKSKKILTVGRISKEKGQIVAIDALKLLVGKGLDVTWYFIGDGSDKHLCEQKVLNEGLDGRVKFLGALVNPYGYMRDCDVYVQPSRYEGYCVTILEALCFNAPIVATNFTSINEQLKGRDNSFVVGMSAEDIANGIVDALMAPKTLAACKVNNTDMEKILSVF